MTASDWRTACPDWRERLLAGRPLVPDLPVLKREPFKSEAARALRVFKKLRLPDVIGTPTMAEAGGDWFFAVVAALLGSYDDRIHRRMIQEVFALVPKGNSKSSNAAMLMLAAIILNRRPRGEFQLIAPTRLVAQTAYDQVDGAIALDEKLNDIFRRQDHLKLITHRNSGATLQIKAADTDVVTGSKAVGTLIDETHEFASKARAQAILVELRGSLAKRPDGFLAQITTQSKVPPAGVFRSELHTARDVRDGVIDLPLLPILYELPEEIAKSGEWEQRKYWPLVNPNLGRSVDETFLANELMKAHREGPAKLALIASQHFNVEIGIGLRTDAWPGAEFWPSAELDALSLDEIIERSDVIVVGADGGGLDDLYGVGVLGRDRDTREWLHWGHAWCHTSVLERRQTIAPALLDFQAAGELTIVTDALDDIEQIVALIQQIKDAGLLGCVAVDPAGIGELVDALDEIGVNQEEGLIVGVPQGFGLMNAIKTAERKLANGTLWHGGSSLMAWCVGNLKIEPTATAIRATKQNAGDAKIDPVMALFNCVYVMSRNPDVGAGSYLETEEIIVL